MIPISFTRNLFISTLFILIAILLISLAAITGPTRKGSEDEQAARPDAMAYILSVVKSCAWLRTPYDGVDDVVVVHPGNWPIDPQALNEQLRKELREQLMTTIRNSLNRDRKISASGAVKNPERFFALYVPANTPVLRLDTNGSSGDIGLYVMRSSMPSASHYDCRSIEMGTRQTCVIRKPKQGIYYVMLRGDARYYGVSVTGARHTPAHLFPSIAITPVNEVARVRTETPNT